MWMKWLLVFSLTLPAWGYRLTSDFQNGFYWASLPINISVVESDPARNSLLNELAQSAVQEWEQRSGFSLWDLASSGTTNIIRWSTNFGAETNMDPSTVLAVAIRYTNGPYFAKAEIVINGNHKDFNTGLAWLNKMNLGTTIVHELGHTMGIDHSEVPQAIMAPTLQTPYPGLNSDDLNALTDAHQQTEHRQLTKYISPLAYSSEKSTAQALSCGTTGPVSSAATNGSMLSLSAGLLISFVRKLFKWFKSLL